ncbi:MAG: hypothetical protein JW889_09005 [Verrucomicrobia bacterium]|nr:hypothetical protein [Verrucomicrobiota bacterium]
MGSGIVLFLLALAINHWQWSARAESVVFLETNGDQLQVFFDGRQIGSSGQPFTLEQLGPGASMLAHRENGDATTDFLIDTSTPLEFRYKGAPVSVALENLLYSSRRKLTTFSIRLTMPKQHQPSPKVGQLPEQAP